MGVKPIVAFRGTARDVRVLNKTENGVSVPFGTEVSVLTEPDGGFLGITVFSDRLAVNDAMGLKGQALEGSVEISPRAGKTGGAFLSADLVSLTPRK